MNKSGAKILHRPILTEKAVEKQADNLYTFEVDKKVNKIEVAKAIKEKYRVTPKKVNIINIKGKITRYGRSIGRTKNWKKAIVFLKKGDKLEFK